MSVFTLQANSNFGAQYVVPFNGGVRFEVESERPISVYVMDPANFAAFRSGQPSTAYWNSGPATVHGQALTLPFRGPWYLVMANYNTLPTAVHYTAWS